ncbi:MAG TPA: serine/threonine-protein kinase [Terriglobia bacterium]|jgi:serine/threonine protein kinase
MESKVEQERLQRIQTIYSQTSPLPPAERKAFLDRACAGNESVRSEVESLLACDSEAETFLDKPAMRFAAESLAAEGAGLLTGRMLGRYQLLGLAGRGGMGDVYCSVDPHLNRLVAVKILPAYLAGDPERFRRFQEEARAIAAMSHPHICILHDAGNDGDTHYLVFEYLVGEALSDRLAQGPLPLTDALRYLIQIAEALEHAHQQAIVHHDLKPQNIMLTRSGVKVLDFGMSGAGTPAYLAPEQTEGRPTDARTDIFAFGLLAREMTAGAAPPALQDVIARSLARQPEERWQSISDVLEILRRI